MRDAKPKAAEVAQSRELAKGGPKYETWKVAVALHLKRTTQASNRWLSEQLHLGRPVAVNQYVGMLRRGESNGVEWLKRLTEKPKA